MGTTPIRGEGAYTIDINSSNNIKGRAFRIKRKCDNKVFVAKFSKPLDEMPYIQ